MYVAEPQLKGAVMVEVSALNWTYGMELVAFPGGRPRIPADPALNKVLAPGATDATPGLVADAVYPVRLGYLVPEVRENRSPQVRV